MTCYETNINKTDFIKLFGRQKVFWFNYGLSGNCPTVRPDYASHTMRPKGYTDNGGCRCLCNHGHTVRINQ